MPVRVALITPFAFPSVRGNAVTVERLARALRGRGLAPRVWDLSGAAETAVEREAVAFRPALVHAFHALRAGGVALRLARRIGVPLVVTMTGTDANHDLFDADRAPGVRRVLEGAAAIVVFDASIGDTLARAGLDVAGRVVVVPQSVSFDGDAAGAAPLAASGPLLVFPAGIRRVKRPRFPLAPLDGVAPRHPGLTLAYAGPIVEPEEGEALLREIAARPWAQYLGVVPHHQMRGLLDAADVVLNCSLSEGGMANSVLEALSLGRAVLASRIDGNRSLVQDGVTGLLFSTPEEFAEQVERLLRAPDLRRRLGTEGCRRVTTLFGPDRELDGHLDLYARLLGGASAVPFG